MDFLQVKFAVKLLEKFAEPLIKKISEISLVEWEKFKVDFDLAFSTYTENAYQKYSKIKTILYRTEPKYIYDFLCNYVCCNFYYYQCAGGISFL